MRETWEEIAAWVVGQPAWQQDALRRIVQKRTLTDSDIRELANACKSEHGLAPKVELTPFGPVHFPAGSQDAEQVTLESITHVEGTNALAPNQTLSFASEGVTVVYGDNAAGKSGFARILKDACRARSPAEFTSNVFSESSPPKPTATIALRTNDVEHSVPWAPAECDSPDLAAVSVFDSASAQVYVSQKTDVPFRPFGLDVFDELARCMSRVADLLKSEREELVRHPVQTPDLREGTEAASRLADLSQLTDIETLLAWADIGDEGRERLAAVENALNQPDPGAAADSLEREQRHLEALLNQAREFSATLTEATFARLGSTRARLATEKRAAEETRQQILAHLLPGTGSDQWRELWKAAHDFNRTAYPGAKFPVADAGSRCVLCQRELTETGEQNLQTLAHLFQDEAQQRIEEAAKAVADEEAPVERLPYGTEQFELAFAALHRRSPALRASVGEAFQDAITSRSVALSHNEDFREPTLLNSAVGALEQTLGEAAKEIEAARQANQGGRDALIHELHELKARTALHSAAQAIRAEVRRRISIATFDQAIAKTNTKSVTVKSTQLTKKLVTENLAKEFRDALDALHFTHTEMELVPQTGKKGALFHQVRFRRSPEAPVEKIVSEGEARCLAIAAFFAELSTAEATGPVLFDDPVSSLDHHWRESVAENLVKRAKSRQVIIFTHDIVFLLALQNAAQEAACPIAERYLYRQGNQAGFSDNAIPWHALKTKDRIARLRDKAAAARTAFKTGIREVYEPVGRDAYGHLREAWERAVEEVLLNGTVERFKKGVETNRAKCLTDITDDDLRTLDLAMTKTSAWIRGHDQAPASNTPVPEPDELDRDIDTLADWVKTIRKRR